MKLLILHPDGILWIEERDEQGRVLAVSDEGAWDPPKGWRYREVVIEGGASTSVRSS
jgi:hypothetical protein